MTPDSILAMVVYSRDYADYVDCVDYIDCGVVCFLATISVGEPGANWSSFPGTEDCSREGVCKKRATSRRFSPTQRVTSDLEL